MSEKHNNLQGEVWTDDDDIQLAETVLRRVRQGDSVIDACREFEEATRGRRTSSASKFRWHTRLKERYAGAYELAKREGKKTRDYKRRKVNQGERYQDLLENVLDKDNEREITVDDILILVKKYKEQSEDKVNEYERYEKETDKLRREIEKLKKELKDERSEKKQMKEALIEVNSNYKKLLDALKVLKEAGIQINIPEPESFEYIVNKDGTVEKM
ncbi:MULTISPECIES: hypothetical protein [Bacillus]|uniref:hypothetical protein n=1 Tax=Bacillus TaxID=1386 RepID=UPI0008FB0CC0|nr:hypothetical protein [Bacillus licheniformis]OIS74625.1 hypothetical protein A4A40_18805 [Bacillus licheniformis]OIS80650.1 hypothetical protein A4A43_09590 [Bacillus licheniformis]OIS82233.1 hypothetical protein A4A38_05555 [Bacillus licheniformis]OIS89974.1 hypothetical protein A4A42_00130 [Bacillus licheniformis]TWK91151.1 Prespore-specific transcriptional regulator RsfA [Bacillus licheniformis]